MFTICKCALCKHFGCKAALLLGEHWPRGSTGRRPVITGRRPVRKKRPTKWVFFFWFPLRFSDALSRSGLTDFSPFVISIYLSSILPCIQSGSTAPGASLGLTGLQGCSKRHRWAKRSSQSPEVFRPKSELSEAFIRTLKFEIYVYTLQLNFEILIWTFQF